jgi:DNA-binding response OmpR family regulator
MTPDAGIPHDVAFVFWPSESARRAELLAAGRPRLLLIAAGVAPPEGGDPLEDWIREPFEALDLEHRAKRLATRARLDSLRPRLDEGGLVHVDGRWVTLSPGQEPLVQLLVDNYGYVVPVADLVAAYGGTEVSLHRVLQRCRDKLRPLGLTIHKIRGGGYQLCAASG